MKQPNDPAMEELSKLLFNLPVDSLTKDQRNLLKIASFGVRYGTDKIPFNLVLSPHGKH